MSFRHKFDLITTQFKTHMSKQHIIKSQKKKCTYTLVALTILCILRCTKLFRPSINSAVEVYNI